MDGWKGVRCGVRATIHTHNIHRIANTLVYGTHTHTHTTHWCIVCVRARALACVRRCVRWRGAICHVRAVRARCSRSVCLKRGGDSDGI